MALPVVAIVGRPNVGKSSLLNRLAGRRIAIVDATPGVTRDRISAPCQIAEGPAGPRLVELVDTGGMGIEDADDLTAHVEEQIAYAVKEAAVVLFVVDAREGVTPLDRQVAERLRRQDKPVLLLANKVDQADLISEINELYALGFGQPRGVSAAHGEGIADLRDALAEMLEHLPAEPPGESAMKLAVVGKRNAGKSTFVNALTGGPRVIVSETPGTTRDSVDVEIVLGERRVTLIDTAGARKRRKIASDVEFYSHARAMRSVRRADVVALLIDASVPASQVDKALAGDIASQAKPTVLVVNKWDLVPAGLSADDYGDYLDKTFPELRYAPVSLTEAQRGRNVRETVELALQLHEQASTRVPTARLNVVLEEIAKLRGPRHKAGTRPPKMLYASQVGTNPPTIVCFVNDPRSFDTAYERFLINQLRDRLPFSEVPIRLFFRQRRPTKGRTRGEVRGQR